MRNLGNPAAARIAFHAPSSETGPPQGDANTRAVGTSLPRREPDLVRTGLAVQQHRAVATNSFHLRPRHLGLARPGVEREAHHGDGDRMICVRPSSARSSAANSSSVRYYALKPVLRRRNPSASTCFIIDDSPASAVRRCCPRDGEIVEPVAHVLRADRIDAPTTEGGRSEPLHGLPAFSAIGEERRRECLHRRGRRMCALRLGIVSQQARMWSLDVH